jgi:hypothetical protein
MLVYTALMFTTPNLGSLLFRMPRPGAGDPGIPYGTLLGVVLMLVFGVLAHLDYTVARRAIKADPSLRGAWLVENAWWAMYIVFAAAAALLFLGTVAFAGLR